MKHSDLTEIVTLIQLFESKALPKDKWTHQAHLSVAVYYLFHNTFFESLCILKSKIITYNEAMGGVNSPTEGYHETLTIFWLKMISCYLDQKKHTSLLEACNEFLTHDWASRDTPFLYYSRERLFSTEARSMWIEPDKKKLPT